MQDNIAIRVKNVSKTFLLPHEKQTSLKGALVHMFRRKRGFERQHVLDDITFDIKKGEFFGIVGRNGSGKSTLLKLLAGIYTPDTGHITINGRLTPFIELGVGFNPELTGRENVFLNGALLGYSRKEMRAMYTDIVGFAELERFMDQKLKNYSSGMQVRLAFSIAIKSQSEVLLFDEVLAVGDERFQKKCIEVFHNLKEEGRTIILVTHDMGNVERFCDRALVLDKSQKISVTTPSKAAAIYARINVDEKQLKDKDASQENSVARRGNGAIRVAKTTLTKDGEPTRIFTTGEPFSLQLDLERQPDAAQLPVLFGLAFFNADGVAVTGPNSRQAQLDRDAKTVIYTIPELPFAPGDYSVTIALYGEHMETLDLLDKTLHFSVISDHTMGGAVEVAGSWSSAK